jgi:hypothetical protein
MAAIQEFLQGYRIKRRDSSFNERVDVHRSPLAVGRSPFAATPLRRYAVTPLRRHAPLS